MHLVFSWCLYGISAFLCQAIHSLLAIHSLHKCEKEAISTNKNQGLSICLTKTSSVFAVTHEIFHSRNCINVLAYRSSPESRRNNPSSNLRDNSKSLSERSVCLKVEGGGFKARNPNTYKASMSCSKWEK